MERRNIKIKTTDNFILDGVFNKIPNSQKQLKILAGSDHGFHSESHETQVVEMILDFFL